jgi:hypothetical protein
MSRLHSAAALALLVATASVPAAEPEIKRPAAAPQGDGVAHVLRTIPEACASLQGRFTGDAKSPYAFAPTRSSTTCQPRARFVDPVKARPAAASGWKLNDVIRVPSKDCPALQAVVEVWRKPGAAAPPKLDAQGRARLYLQDAKAGDVGGAAVTQYTAKLALEGTPCP